MVRVTDSESNMAECLRRREGLNVSQWFRICLRGKYERSEKDGGREEVVDDRGAPLDEHSNDL